MNVALFNCWLSGGERVRPLNMVKCEILLLSLILYLGWGKKNEDCYFQPV
jgi:hypothetical protein